VFGDQSKGGAGNFVLVDAKAGGKPFDETGLACA
jgi:hypothetical protein